MLNMKSYCIIYNIKNGGISNKRATYDRSKTYN